ncbi:hypothetical protein QBC38DRAFT_440273 [Podospora fimiseda]|uniref:Uncharacterized protein n=1 Tax=Podospora fimiseda TaxID=252190 RepID=A0AAN7H3J3_9PEZI|nr:hypothetical protein QBC38DRAFT_440273 [Podospora fimiseda]
MSPPFLSSTVARRRVGTTHSNSPIQARSSRQGPISRETWIVGAVFASIIGFIVCCLVARYLQVKYFRRGIAYKPTLREDDSPTTRQINRSAQDGLEETLTETQARNGQTLGATNNTAGVDRNTSVRSVMTLPAYRPKAAETEQVLGREGERDGIDVVVEMPTAEQEEAMRESEMEALYQIRAARRRQLEEREERRRLRQQAREANDVVAMRELRERGRQQTTSNTLEIELLRSQHEQVKENRTRAVSSVAYAEVGVARADGTRIRANSTDSERVGLLSDAASIAASTNGSGLLHRRERSGSSLSIDTSGHDRPNSPGLTTGGSAYSLASAGLTPRSRADSGATTPRISSATTRAGSSPELIEAADADLGDLNMPPPDYDEVSLSEITPGHSRRNSNVSAVSGRNSPYNEPPPDYPGPARTRSNRLSAQMQDLAAQAQPQPGSEEQQQDQRNPNRLPSLRVQQVPQIVIEPSSALP